MQAWSLEHLPILGIEPAGDIGHTAGSGLSTFWQNVVIFPATEHQHIKS